MTTTGSLLKLGRDMQALALAGENIKLAKKSLNKKKKIKTKDLIGLSAKNIIGVELIKTQAQLSSGL